MKLTSTQSKRPIYWLLSLFLILITLISSKSYAQQVYATTATVKSNVVDNPNNALGGGGFATVRSYGGVALGIGSYSGELELRFPGTVPANKTTFIRIGFDADILNALLGGNLGSDLANLLGTVALGNHYFEAGARNGTNTVLSGASSGSFSNSNLRIVKDASGNFYVAITPSQSYDRVYIKDHTAALLLGVNNATQVYGAFYTSGGSACDPAFATDFDGSGLTASLLGIGKAGVTNMEGAIDADPNSASEIGLGLIGVLGTISQNFYFNTPSSAADELNIRFQITPALVNAGLLNNISIATYLGNSPVSSHSASSLLNVDLIGLLNSGNPVRVGIPTGGSFDRVRISLTSLLNVSLEQTLNVFDVSRTAARPTFTGTQSNSVFACYNSTATLGATTQPGYQLLWYDQMEGGTLLASTASTGTFTTPALTATRTFYVAALRSGCAASIRVPVVVTVNPNIVFATTTLNPATLHTAYSRPVNPATGGTGPYQYTLAAGSVLPPGLTISSAGIIAGTPTVAGTYNFNLTVRDSRNCTTTTAFSLLVSSAFTLPAATLPDGVVGTTYPAQFLPAASGGNAPYTYQVSGLPPGLAFDPPTRAITGTPTTIGNYVIKLTATDAQGNTVSRDYSLTVNGPLTLAGGTLPPGTVGVFYSPQFLAAASGGNMPYTYTATGLPPGLQFTPGTREVRGIPTQGGNYTIILTATDANSKSVTANYAIVIGSGSGTIDCNAANSQTSGITGVCVLCNVTGPQNSVDGDKLNFTRITLSVGVAASGYQRLIFPKPGLATDSVLLDLALPTGLVDLSVLSGINVQVMNGSTIVRSYALNSSLLSLRLLGGTRFMAVVPAGGVFDRVEVSFSATVAALTSLDIYGASVIYQNPVIVSAGLSVCSGSTTTINATPGANTTLTWYAAPSGGTALASGNSFTTPVLTATTTYYIALSREGCAMTERVPVTVTVSNSPAVPIPTAGNPTTACAGTSVTLSVQPVAGISFRWYDENGTLLATNSGNYLVPANLPAGDYTFAVEAVNAGGCSNSQRTSISLSITTSAVASDIQVNNPGSACSATAVTLMASSNSVTNPVFKWYSNTALTNLVYTGPTFTTPALTVPTTYYVTVSGTNRCENTPVTAAVVTLNINVPATASDITVAGTTTVCGGSSTSLTASSTTVTNPIFKWYSDVALSTLVFTGSTFTTPAITANISYYVTVSGSNRCENTSAGAKVVAIVAGTTVNTPTIAGNGTSICAGGTGTLTIQNPQTGVTYEFYSSATGGTPLFTGTTVVTPPLNANTEYFVQGVNASGCVNPGGRVRVLVVVGTRPMAPAFAATTINSCLGSTATLTVSNPQSGTTYTYYTSATGGTALGTGTTYTTGALAGNTIIYVEASAGSCSSATRTAVTITAGNVLATPVIAVDSKTNNSILFSWNNIAGATGYEVSTDGGATWQNPSTGSSGTSHLVTGLVAAQTVTLTVRAKGTAACQTSASATPVTEQISTLTEALFVPNTFTPNGDGRNDVFNAFGNAVNRYRMRVYNQWGEFIFESNAMNMGWDGTFRGMMQPNGVYAYYIDVTFSNGKSKMMKGTVTLLR